jgi:hypothetical protein
MKPVAEQEARRFSAPACRWEWRAPREGIPYARPVMTRRFATTSLILVAAAAFLTGCSLSHALPTAHFTAEPSEGMSPLVVRFDGPASAANNGAIIAYVWAFGDGSIGSGLGTAHLYASDEEQTYVVTLTVTDQEGRQSSASEVVTVFPPPPPPAERVEFVWPFHYDADGEDAVNMNDEYFALRNTGDVVVDMSGWTVENERGVMYRFPDGFVLPVNAFVYVHSGAGVSLPGILYWNAAAPIWHNTTDIAVLRDAEGGIIDVYAYASC